MTSRWCQRGWCCVTQRPLTHKSPLTKQVAEQHGRQNRHASCRQPSEIQGHDYMMAEATALGKPEPS